MADEKQEECPTPETCRPELDPEDGKVRCIFCGRRVGGLKDG